MKISISAPAPALDLQARSHSDALAALGLLGWATLDQNMVTTDGGRITEVAPRSGAYGLVKTADSAGPQVATAMGLSGGKMVAGALCYLYSPAPIDEAEFSLAMIWHLDAYLATAQDLFACYGGGSSLRMWQLAGKVTCRFGATDVVAGVTTWNTPGPMLTILSASGGTVRTRTRNADTIGAIRTGTRIPTLGSNCRAVFGADEINDGAIGAAPSSARAMRDTLFDSLIFGRDILAAADDPALGLIDQYFNEVYAHA